MDSRQDRDQQETQLKNPEQPKKKRFRLIRLEERIAPASSSGQAGVFGGSTTGGYAGTSR